MVNRRTDDNGKNDNKINLNKNEGRKRNSKTNKTSDVRNKNNSRRKSKRSKSENTILSRKSGILLAEILLINIIIAVFALVKLNIFSRPLMIVIVVLLVGTLVGLTANQLLSKKKAIIGKCVLGVMSIVLAVVSFYGFKTDNMIYSITNNSGIKIDRMVVVVLKEDPAETIQDTIDYLFGVQYSLSGEHTIDTIEQINEVCKTEIKVQEYNDLDDQVRALLNGEIGALIYNEAYVTIIEEEIPEYLDLVKTVYVYEKVTELEIKNTDVDITKDPFAVYISGIDVYGSIGTSSRSDLNIIAYINPETRQILLVNTPRDFYVSFPEVTGSAKDKLTHAGIYGVNTSIATLEELYDSEIDFYIRLNFTSLINIVDALGGLTVYSEQSFTTSSDVKFRVEKGFNTLNGSQALAFARERYALPGGDNARGKNQQAVITAMIEKAVSPAILTGANQIFESVSNNVDTDMSQADIQTLIKTQLADGRSWNIKSMSATGTDDRQYCYSYSSSTLYVMQPNYESIDKIKIVIQALQNGEILTDELVAQ